MAGSCLSHVSQNGSQPDGFQAGPTDGPSLTLDAGASDGATDGSQCATISYVNGPTFIDPAPPVVDAVVHPIARNRLAANFDANTVPSATAGDWSLVSQTDPAYATAHSPTGVSIRSKSAALNPNTWPYTSTPEYEAVLELGTALSPGFDYRLSLGGASWSFTFDPNRQWSPSIKVNQIGYSPNAEGRHAYVGYWLGDGLSPMTLGGDELAFHVIDAETSTSVLSGALALRVAFDAAEDVYGTNYSKANVYDADLQSLTTPGSYYLVWDGVGRSPTFTVSEAIYDLPFVTVFRALFHQRCGMELSAEYTKWSHGACHQAPVTLTTADYQVIGEDAYSALPAAATSQTANIRGGYHDAGDYDKNYGHMLVVDDLLDLYELDPMRFQRDDFGLPESGNHLPDLIDEALWGISFWAQMQDDSGGVRGGTGSNGPPAWTTMPDQDTAPWFANATDPISSYWFAGIAAKMSRVIRSFDEVQADAWLVRAEGAFAWAEANRRSYPNKSRDAYAAAELFKTTGDATYETAFVGYSPFSGGNLNISLPDTDAGDLIPAYFAYVTAPAADANRKAAALSALKARADSFIVSAKKTGYRFVKHPYAPIGWGSYTTPREAGFLFRVHALTQDPALLEWGTYTCDLSLGANADGVSWVTGLGQFSVAHPLQIPSIADGIDQAVPGIVVYGPSSDITGGGIEASVLSAYQPTPGDWPVSQLFADVSYTPILDEFTVSDTLAPTIFAFGYLATLDSCP